MKLTFRTVSGESFQLDAEESMTIGGLKTAVEEARSISRDSLKLVYKGKVLDNDDATVGVAGINEQGFIVVFVAKKAEPAKAAEAAPTPSPTPAATPPAAASAAAPAPAAPAPAPAAAAPAPAAASEAAAAAAGQPAAAGGGGVAGFLTGPALEEAVNNICEMGFDRAQVVQAMRAAFNNPERAVEYLTTGIPASAVAPPAPAAGLPAGGPPAAGGAAAPAAQQAGAGGPAALPFNMFGGPAAAGAEAGGAGGAPGSLDFLRSLPQFQVLRQTVRGNPNILTPMLQELGRANPRLIQIIQANQEEFLRMLQEEPSQEEMEALGALAGMAAGAGGEEGGMIQVELTEEDMQKVERLQALGFQRDACIEALIACDHNEEMAANFLAEQMFD